MSVQILLVEDSPGDIRLTREAFRDSGLSVNFHVAVNGHDALEFLRRDGVHVLAPRPDLILLDLDLPEMSGLEVLNRIKADEDLMAIPTIVLTNSEISVDIILSYQYRANCYLSKPSGLAEFQSLVRDIGDFWFTKVRLPRRDALNLGIAPIEEA
jgi:chemotaxis family two-component system response regulator Rcp1